MELAQWIGPESEEAPKYWPHAPLSHAKNEEAAARSQQISKLLESLEQGNVFERRPDENDIVRARVYHERPPVREPDEAVRIAEIPNGQLEVCALVAARGGVRGHFHHGAIYVERHNANVREAVEEPECEEPSSTAGVEDMRARRKVQIQSVEEALDAPPESERCEPDRVQARDAPVGRKSCRSHGASPDLRARRGRRPWEECRSRRPRCLGSRQRRSAVPTVRPRARTGRHCPSLDRGSAVRALWIPRR